MPASLPFPGERRYLDAVLGCLAALFITANAGAMTDAQRLEERNALHLDVETPHTPWARPYGQGTVRALFLVNLGANINGLPLRHTVELMQRFDLAGDAVLVMPEKGTTYAIAFSGDSGVYGGEAGERRLARLLEQSYDCYVVTGPILDHLPAASRKIILDRVRAGAGLVLWYDQAIDALLKEATPMTEMPGFLADLDARLHRFGKGRAIVAVPRSRWNVYAPTPTQNMFGMDRLRDLAYEAQGRPILWAAGAMPKATLTIALPAPTIEQRTLSKQQAAVSWQGAPPGNLKLATRIRDIARLAQAPFITRRVNGSEGTVRVGLPRLAAGEYWVDAILYGDGGVEAWGNQSFDVSSPDRIAHVRLDDEWTKAGDTISGHVVVTAAEAGRPAPKLRVQAIDRFGRAQVRRELPATPGEHVFHLSTADWMPGYLGVEAQIVRGKSVTRKALAPSPFTLPRHKQDQFNFMLWGRLYASPFLELADDMLAARGVTSRIETSSVPWWYMTRAGMNYTPYCGAGLYRLPDQGPQEPMVNEHGILAKSDGCWNEPAADERLQAWLDAERDFRRHGVLVYSMGDEQAVFGSCLHPACWQTYRDWLANEYGSIEALNASWESEFTDFAAIEPLIDWSALPWLNKQQKTSWVLTYANNEHGSKGLTHGSTAWTDALKNYSRYIDRRSFQYWNFANYARRFRDTARRMDPNAICGVEGTDIHLDADIDMIVRNTGWWMPYAGENGGQTNEVIRSIAPRSYRHGNFTGWTHFWFNFLRGASTVGRWRIDNYLTPRMSLYPREDRMVESARIVFDGLGTLLNVHESTRPQHDGIVILHAMAAVKMAKIGDGPSYGIFRTRDDGGKSLVPDERFNWRNHRAWCRTIRAAGLQFQYTTDGQIRRGEFEADTHRVMILAQHEVIGPAEESVIRHFVQNGGTLIADVRPGIYGARGKARSGGVLDDLFGVRHTGSAAAVETDGRITDTVDGDRVDVTLSGLRVNPALVVTNGRPRGRAGNTPIFIDRRVGKGRAILLNFAKWSYPKIARHDTPEAAARLMEAIFTEAGIRRPLEVRAEDGRRHRNIETMRWRTGTGVEVVALLGPARETWPEPNGNPFPVPAPFDKGLHLPVPATVVLTRDAHVIEMRSGRRAGPVRAFDTGVLPWWATFLVISDHPLKAPALVSPPTVRRGERLKVRVKLPGTTATHALALRVTNPDNRSAPWFDRSIIATDGSALIELPIAHNEAMGRWRFTITDLYGQGKASAAFEVR